MRRGLSDFRPARLSVVVLVAVSPPRHAHVWTHPTDRHFPFLHSLSLLFPQRRFCKADEGRAVLKYIDVEDLVPSEDNFYSMSAIASP